MTCDSLAISMRPELEAAPPRYPAVLGYRPVATLACFVDLGLSDFEIARYFHLDTRLVARIAAPLRRMAGRR